MTDRYGKVELVPKPQLDAALLNRILSCLHPDHNKSLDTICALMGVQRTGKRHTKAAFQQYKLIGRGLQQLKKEGSVKYVGGKNAGWRLT